MPHLASALAFVQFGSRWSRFLSTQSRHACPPLRQSGHHSSSAWLHPVGASSALVAATLGAALLRCWYPSPVGGLKEKKVKWKRAEGVEGPSPGAVFGGNGRVDFFFWKAYLSIEQPLTAHDPIHPQVSSRHDP